MDLSKEQLLGMYRQMWTIRLFEDALASATLLPEMFDQSHLFLVG